MQISGFFGGDDHTGQDGPYSRMLKCRKWIYLSALGILIISHGLYDQAGLKQLLPFLNVPREAVYASSALGGSYLVLQYLMLADQFRVSHDIIIKERFRHRKEAELDRLNDAMRETQGTLDMTSAQRARELQSGIDAAQSRAAELEALIAEAYEEIRVGVDEIPLRRAIANNQRGVEAARKEEHLLRARSYNLELEADISAINQKIAHLKRSLAELEKDNPSQRRGYVRNEYAIDLMRLAAPVVTFAVVLVQSWLI